MRARVGLAAAAIAVAIGAGAAAVEPGEQRGIAKTVSHAALPGGLVLTVEPGSFAVERGTLRAPLTALGRGTMPRALKGVDIDPDGGHVIATITDSCDHDHTVDLTIAGLSSRIDDVAAEVRAANEVKAGKPADAARTLAPLLDRAPIATYAQVATDPALAPLVRRPELARLRAARAGTAKLALGKNDVTMTGKGKPAVPLAVSSHHRLIAAVDTERSEGACAGDADLVLLDPAGTELARIALYTAAEMTTDESRGCPFARPARPKIAARVAAAQRLLADLGFSPATGEAGAIVAGSPGAQFPRAQLVLVRERDRVRILRGDDERGHADAPGHEPIDAATYLPDSRLVVLRWGRRGGCAGAVSAGIQVIPLRAAAP